MSKRLYKPQTDKLALPDLNTALPTTEPIAVYYRQSTIAQVGNVSTDIQTVDMKEYLKQRGWSEDYIWMIDMDEGVSGTKKIDERPGMRALFDLIVEGKIRAVACQDEDRLFRDVTQIQVNIFIDACRGNNVLVIAPSMIYDFANPLTGTFHARQFRFKSEMAAEYINSVIRGKLHRAKNRLMQEGRWVGGCMAPGYMVDVRKTLPDGSENPQRRCFVPFEPYTEIIREYFRLFLSYSGNVRLTELHIHRHGPYYPDPQDCPPPPGFKVVYNLHRYGNGYCPGRTALIDLFTNAAYIGHWSKNKTIVRWNNHEPIVPLKLFMRAFNYLSPVSLDGQPNPNYAPIQENVRPSCDTKRPVDRPLCAGMLVSKLNGRWRNVGINWIAPLKRYCYVVKTSDLGQEYLWSKMADAVDDEIGKLVRERLRETFASDYWERTIGAFQENFDKEYKGLYAQRAALERVMQRHILSLETLDTPEMLLGVQARYKEAQAEHARLTSALAAAENEARQIEFLQELRETCSPAVENWDEMTRDEKRVVLSAFIKRIEATPVAKPSILQLLVHWHGGDTDKIILRRQAAVGNQWSNDDIEQLLYFVDSHASQLGIAAAFPTRTWRTIRCKVYDLRGKAALRILHRRIYDEETYEMYQARIATNISPQKAGSGARWTEQETTTLLNLLTSGASPFELAEAFPQRTWKRIRAKIRSLKRDAIHIHGKNDIMEEETIVMCRARKARVGSNNPVMDTVTFEAVPEKSPG